MNTTSPNTGKDMRAPQDSTLNFEFAEAHAQS